MSCPSDRLLGALAQGRLTPARRAVLTRHLHGCRRCERAAAELLRLAAPAPHDGAAATRVGRYVLLRRLGAGGMGEVHEAYDSQLKRNVALKLLWSEVARAEEAPREALALARLAHPNVVTVFDAGVADGQAYLAMELVNGGTLRDWLAAGREPEELLRAFVEAGRGLAAAHAAGLVHRDFKPQNVLVAEDGRVRVSDFGLAWASASPAPAQRPPIATATSAPWTQRGGGTPEYMAPEQSRGQAATAQSDQYSFCVALHEALYGRRPESQDGVLRRPERAGSPELWALIARGLSLAPKARHPSMEALLHALQELPRRRAARRRVRALALAALVTAALGAGNRLHQQRRCLPDGDELAGVWDPQAQAALRDHLLGLGRPLSAPAWESARVALDDYAARWRALRRESCEATKVRQERSEASFTAVSTCLAERRRGMAALIHLLGEVEPVTLEEVGPAARELPELASCAEPPPLRAAEPVTAAEALDALLFRARAAVAVRRKDQALALAGQAQAQAAAAKDRRREAQAHLAAGAILAKEGPPAEAYERNLQAFLAAQAASEPLLGAAAATRLAYVAATQLDRLPAANEWASQAEALLEAREDLELRAELLRVRALAELMAGRPPSAERDVDQAIALLRGRGPTHDLRLASALQTRGSVLLRLGRRADAAKELEQVLAQTEQELGSSHPRVAAALVVLGQARRLLGEIPRADAVLSRAVQISNATLPREHPVRANALGELAQVRISQRRFPEAVELSREALELFSERPPQSLANARLTYASALYSAGRWDEALAQTRQALELARARLGEAHSLVAILRTAMAELLVHRWRAAEARPFSLAALEAQEKAIGRDNPVLIRTLLPLADAERQLGRPAAALPLLDRALALEARGEVEPEIRVKVRALRARVLTALGAAQQAQAARAEAQAESKHLPEEQRAEALEDHPRPATAAKSARPPPGSAVSLRKGAP